MTRSLVIIIVVCSSLYARTSDAGDPAPSADDPAPSTEPPPAPPPSVDPEVEKAMAKAAVDSAGGETIMVASGSMRSTAEEFLVLPDGAEVGGRLRTIMADDGLGVGKIKLTDLALFDVSAEWAIAHHYELDASVSVLPKQPSTTSERIFQGGSLTLRRDLAHATAIALSGSGGPLLGMKGLAFGGSAFVTHKHRLNNIVTFTLAGGATSTFLRPTGGEDHPYLIEGAGHAAVLVRIPDGVWGGWMGVGYALPAFHRGHDPTSGMTLDPQPRLDLNIGNAVQLAEKWDLIVELSIIDRGDLTNPATHLPILDGGFDQIQFTVGVSRRLDLSKDSQRQRGISDPLMIL